MNLKEVSERLRKACGDDFNVRMDFITTLMCMEYPLYKGVAPANIYDNGTAKLVEDYSCIVRPFYIFDNIETKHVYLDADNHASIVYNRTQGIHFPARGWYKGEPHIYSDEEFEELERKVKQLKNKKN